MKHWLALSALAAVVTLWLYPRAFRGVTTPPSDAAAIEATRTLLRNVGIDPAAYQYTVGRSFSMELKRRSLAFQGTRWADTASPSQISVNAESPDGRGRMTIKFSEALRPLSWSVDSLKVSPVAAGQPWVTAFGGKQADCFRPVTAKKEDLLRWDCAGDTPRVEFEVELDKEGHPAEARLLLRDSGGGKTIQDYTGDTAKVVAVVMMIPLVPLAVVWTLQRRRRQRDHLKSAFRIAVIFLILAGALLAAGLFQGGSWKSRALTVLGQPELLLVVLAPGLRHVRGWQIRSWLGAFRLGSAQVFERQVGKELLAGLLAGPLIAGVASVFSQLPAAVPNVIPFDQVESWFAFPSAVVRFPSENLMVLVFFGVMTPWILRDDAPKRWKWVVTAVSAVVFVAAGPEYIAGNGLANVLASCLIAWVLWRLYVSAGVLAVCAALPAAAAIPGIALALSRMSVFAGLREGLVYVAALAGAYCLSRFGRPEQSGIWAAEMERRSTPLPEEIRSERERLLTEVSLAREAQQALLPKTPPRLDGYSIAATCVAAGEVGGDLYDYLPFANGRVAFCVADVSGKGVTASVYNTFAKGMLAALARRNLPLTELALELNKEFLDTARRKTFITIVMALLDRESGQVELLRLGHNPPLLHRAATGEMIWLSPPGLGVGLASSLALRRVLRLETVHLQAGDTLLLYSDGLTEAMNGSQELFGEQRLSEFLARNAHRDAEGLMSALLHDVDTFRDGAAPNDDLTLLVIQSHSRI